MQNTKKRIFYLDELRAIAIFGVILCHISNLYPHATTNIRTIIPFFFNDLGAIGVPIFLMLSGALLLNREYELGSFFKRRFSRILIPFIFWIIITGLIRFFILGDPTSKIVSWTVGHGITWYVWMLIGLYLALPILNTFIQKYQMSGVKYFLVFWIISILFTMFHFNKVFTHLEFKYFSGCIGYMVLGYYLYKSDFKINDITMILLGFVMFIVGFIINCQISSVTGNTADYTTFVTIIESMGIFLIFKYISSISDKRPESITAKVHNFIEKSRLGAAVVSISICSYGMYFVHYIIYHTLELFDFHSLKLVPVLWIFTILLSWAIIWIMSKIPYLNKVCGV